MVQLLDGGAEVNAKRDGDTSLILACHNGHVDAARLLLARGADIEAKTAWNDTSLDIAKREGHKAVVALLAEHQK